MKYEYIVAVEQQGRVTFVNDKWVVELQGSEPSQDDVMRCPYYPDFLNSKGAEGWELVSVVLVPSGDQFFSKMFLRREIV